MPIAVHAHHARMPSSWKKANDKQLELKGIDPAPPVPPRIDKPTRSDPNCGGIAPAATTQFQTVRAHGHPLVLTLARLYEDPHNPRTEFPDAELDELADDIRQNGILQPIVVHPADAAGRYRIHFGAMRLRAARRAGLQEVPVVVRDTAEDPYAQVAENQKRHGLTPLDLTRFIKDRVAKGDSNAFIAKRLGMNLTTVAHHLTLLALPPELDQALKAGRCTSPRTLHELSMLHETEPDKVRALVSGDAEITRSAVAAMKAERSEPATKPTVSARPDAIARAHAACARLERALAQIERLTESTPAPRELVALRIRVQALAASWLQGSDRQTPALRKGSDRPTPTRPT
jgi:ParB family transcriptional regulator, chromosome partitioning protein